MPIARGRRRRPSFRYASLRARPIDCSHEAIDLHGLRVVVKIVWTSLAYGRMPIMRAYFRKTPEMVFEAHDKTLALRQVCRRGRGGAPSSSAAPGSTTRASRSFAHITLSSRLCSSSYATHDPLMELSCSSQQIEAATVDEVLLIGDSGRSSVGDPSSIPRIPYTEALYRPQRLFQRQASDRRRPPAPFLRTVSNQLASASFTLHPGA